MLLCSSRIAKATLISILLLTIGCLDPIKFDRPETLKDKLAIQGKLLKGDTNSITVSIRKVFDFSSTPAFVNAKTVTLFDEAENSVELPSRQNGVHFLDLDASNTSFSVEYDKCYRLKIELFDGRQYESEVECLQPAPKPDHLIVSKVEETVINGLGELEKENLITFSIDSPLTTAINSPNGRLLWELEVTYKFTDTPEVYRNSCFPIRTDPEKKTCFYTESTFFNYIPFDGTQVSQSSISNELVWKVLPSFIFAEGLYLTIYQQSLTETAFEYWQQVHQLASRTGDIFEPTDAKVITNFVNIENPEEEVYGYFYATESHIIRNYVSPEFAENPRAFCPLEFPFGTPPADCCNCLSNSNATLEKPIWWLE